MCLTFSCKIWMILPCSLIIFSNISGLTLSGSGVVCGALVTADVICTERSGPAGNDPVF